MEAEVATEEEVGCEPEEEADACGEGKTDVEGVDGLAQQGEAQVDAVGVFDVAFESHDGKQGHGELGDDEYGGHGAELVVHGEVVEEEVGKPHEVLAPGEGDGEHGGYE